MPEVQVGDVCYHFKNKNNFYKIVGIAVHSETKEKMVIYEPLYPSETKLWVRPLSMFLGEVEHDGVRQPRFSKVS